MKHFLPLIAVAALLASEVPAQAQTRDPGFALSDIWQPGGVNQALVQPDGKRLVLGSFSRADGQAVGNLVRFNPDGTLDQAYNATVGSYRWVPQQAWLLPSGKLLVRSAISFVGGGQTRRNLILLNADGTVDASFDAGAGAGSPFMIRTAAQQPDGKLLVGGSFDSFSSHATKCLVRLLPSGAVDNTFTLPATAASVINSVVVQPDGNIVVAGNIGSAYRLVGRLLPSGAFDPAFQLSANTGSSSSYSQVLLQPDGKVLVGTGSYVYRLLPTGAVDATFTAPAISNGFTTLALQANGSILLGGTFTQVGTQAVAGVARLLSTGAFDPSFQPPATLRQAAPRMVQAIPQPDGQVLLASASSLYPTGNLREPRRIILLGANGTVNSAFAPELLSAGSVSQVLPLPNGQVVVGGSFSLLGGQRVANIARFDAGGQVDTAFANRAATNGVVTQVRNQAGSILVTGYFTSVRGVPTQPLVRLAPSGQLDPTFANGTAIAGTFVNEMAVTRNGSIIATGYLLQTGSANSSLQKLQPDGKLDNTFTSTLGSSDVVDRIKLTSGDKVLVFSYNANFSAARLVRLTATGSLDPAFTPVQFSQDDYIEALTVDRQDRPIAAIFTSNATNPTYQLVRYPATGSSSDATFATNSIGLADYVSTIEEQPNGRLLLAGAFSAGAPGTADGPLRRVLNNGQVDAAFSASNFSGNGFCVSVQADGKVLLGGSGLVPIVSGGTAGIVRLLVTNVLHVAASQATNAATAAWPVPAHGTLHLQLDAVAQPRQASLLNLAGQTVRTQLLGSTALVDVDLNQLATGVYLLRVDYATGSVTRRIVVE